MESIKIGLLGCGVLGSSIIKQGQEKRFYENLFIIDKILVNDLSKPRHSSLEGFHVTTDPMEIISDESINVVVDALANENDSFAMLKDSMNNGKSAITTDRYLLLKYGIELAHIANQKGVQFRFSPALGFNPQLLETAHGPDTVARIIAVVDDTMNSLLSVLRTNHADLETASKAIVNQSVPHDAVAKSINGEIAASKLALLIMLVTKKLVDIQSISRIPFENIDMKDILRAEQMGYVIKQIAYFENKGNYFRACVAPMLIKEDNILSLIKEQEIGLCFEYVDTGMRYVVFRNSNDYIAQLTYADLIKIRDGQFLMPSFCLDEKILFKDEQKFSSNYFIRIKTLDHQFILNKMIALAESHNIAIKDISLEKADEPNHTDLFLMTHPILEESANKIVRAFQHSDFVKEAKKIRILGI